MIKMLLSVAGAPKPVTYVLKAFSELWLIPLFIFNCQAALCSDNLSVTAPFKNNTPVPVQFVGSSPALNWSGAPASTRSFVVICHDPDAPNHHFVHWLAYDIPATKTSLAQGAGSPANREIRQGVNSFHRLGYDGPSPPPGQLHHYIFTVYALNTLLGDLKQPVGEQLSKAMSEHVLGRGEVTGTFIRNTL